MREILEDVKLDSILYNFELKKNSDRGEYVPFLNLNQER